MERQPDPNVLPHRPPASADEEWKQAWILWFALNFLYEKAKAGALSVSATELRQAVLDELEAMGDPKAEEKRDVVVQALAETLALVRTNLTGFKSRRYFMTERPGRLMFEVYAAFLLAWAAEGK